jgi:hypothetical protein
MLGQTAGSFVGNQIANVGRAGAGGVSGQLMGAAFGMVPYAGPMLGAAINAGSAYYQRHLGVQRARLQAGAVSGVGEAGLGKVGRGGLFGGLGIGPSEAPGMIEQLAQGTGRQGPTDLREAAPAALGAQRYFGVTAPQRMLRAAESTRPMEGLMGQTSRNDPESSQMSAMASAFAAGLRMTDMEEILGNLATWLQNVADRGIPIDLEGGKTQGVLGAMRSMGALGLASGQASLGGRSGANFMSQFTSTAGGAAQGSDPFAYLMLRAAGLGNGRDLMEAQAYMENPENSGTLFLDVLEQMVGQGGADGHSESAIAHAMQRGFGERGIQMSSQFWLDLAKTKPDDIAEARLGGGPEGLQAGMAMFGRATRARIGEQAGATGTVRGEAAIERQEVDMGAEAQEAVMLLRNAELSITRVFLPAVLGFVTNVTEQTIAIINAWKSGNMGQVAALIGNMAAGGASPGTAASGLLNGVASVARNAGLPGVADVIEGAAGAAGAGGTATAPGAAPGAGGAVGETGAGLSAPSGSSPLSDARMHLGRAAEALARFERSAGMSDSDLETV